MATTLSFLNTSLHQKPFKNLSHFPKFFSKLPNLQNPTKTLFSKPHHPQKPFQQFQNFTNPLKLSTLSSATLILSPFLNHPQDAVAIDGEFGLLEGRTLALVHPLVMGSLFFYTLWAGYLGWQWRRVRTIQNEINELKKEVKPVLAVESAELTVPISPAESKIQQLTEERRELIKGSYKDRHFNAGSILLAFGVFESIGGAVNTWFRTGKLFPGPHLFAGAAITALWASAAALVPWMQKGSETARNLHIALNALNVLLFIWQIPTGLDIVFKVFEFTKWP
eukprot:TRINITY_DN21187_c0_g1_i1.p1 TRINITY_DN21187_c0_g1~~TRINITY_DN21187_c0_g1_i1.p1  ORF type:complete len:280 (-),score=28.75 TRINITY_DN21187_c0_g1_i1:199-1038(-)